MKTKTKKIKKTKQKNTQVIALLAIMIALLATVTILKTSAQNTNTTIIFKQYVINNDGGNLTEADFSPTLNGQVVAEKQVLALNPGTYTRGTQGSTGYTRAFSRDCAQENISFVEGNAKECIITYNDIPASITLTTQVVDANGITLTEEQTPVYIDGVLKQKNAAQSIASGERSIGGACVCGFTVEFSGDCNSSGKVTIEPGVQKQCTVIYRGIPVQSSSSSSYSSNSSSSSFQNVVSLQKLTIELKVENDHGGTLTENQVQLQDNGQSISPGNTYEVTAGNHLVSVTPIPGYDVIIGGDCSDDGLVLISLNADIKCTVTLRDIAPNLTVTPSITNAGGGTKTLSDFTFRRNGNPQTVTTLGSIQTSGQYQFTVDQNPEYAVSFGGDCASSGIVNIVIGEVKTCEVTLTFIPTTLQVSLLQNIPSNSTLPTAFNFRLDNAPFAFNSLINTAPGTHTITFSPVTNYAVSFSNGCSSTGGMTINPGTSATCTITVQYTGVACNGLMPTIISSATTINGTPGNDVIVGSSATNLIYPGTGNDTVCAGDGSDYIYETGATSGNDQLYGEGGVDYIYNYGGTDIIDVGEGNGNYGYNYSGVGNTIRAGNGIGNFLYGSPQNDTFTIGNGGGNYLYGYDGADAFTVGNGAGNYIYGGTGNDTLVGGTGTSTYYGDAGTDSCTGSVASTYSACETIVKR